MLWELALRKADQPQRAQWVLWEMTRRFPDQLPCRVELARLLADSGQAEAEQQALGVLQQVLQLDADNLHAHSTLAQLAIRRQDWDGALFHAQQGLRVDAANEPCAMLLATAYARRNAPGDLDCAIEHLQRFVTRYPGNPNADGYLRVLLKRQQQAAQGKLVAGDDGAATQPSPKAAPEETDAAWLAFQASLQPQAATGALAGRVLPLPQALSVALQEQDWQALADFDEASQEEFPLETQLWRYLSLLNQPQAALPQKNAAREALQACLDHERQAPSYDSKSWLDYLAQHWHTLQTESPEALASGRAWLADLLARYQPLPAPLMG
jgi:tetratricopeptide (TPR) repeat protein